MLVGSWADHTFITGHTISHIKTARDKGITRLSYQKSSRTPAGTGKNLYRVSEAKNWVVTIAKQ
jgi:hypothetical protein